MSSWFHNDSKIINIYAYSNEIGQHLFCNKSTTICATGCCVLLYFILMFLYKRVDRRLGASARTQNTLLWKVIRNIAMEQRIYIDINIEYNIKYKNKTNLKFYYDI